VESEYPPKEDDKENHHMQGNQGGMPTIYHTEDSTKKRTNGSIETDVSNRKKKKPGVPVHFSEGESGSESDSEDEHEQRGHKLKQGAPEVDSRHKENDASQKGEQDDFYENEGTHDYDDYEGDGDVQRWNLTIDDLKPRPKNMPKTQQEVYNKGLRLINLDDRARVRKVTRDLLFPKQKFVSPEERKEYYDCPKEIVKGSVQYKLLKKLSWTGKKTNQVEMAIRWNTYSKEVEKTLKQQQSTSISQIKKMFLDGKFLFISA